MGRGGRAHPGKGPWAERCPSHADILSASHQRGRDTQVGMQEGRASFFGDTLGLLLSSADSVGSPVPASWTLPALHGQLAPTASSCRKPAWPGAVVRSELWDGAQCPGRLSMPPEEIWAFMGRSKEHCDIHEALPPLATCATPTGSRAGVISGFGVAP